MNHKQVLLEYYKEHAAQARQHENQRERMTVIILTIAGVLIALITKGGMVESKLLAPTTLILIGAFGFVFSIKHYERSKLHHKIMGGIRKEIDSSNDSSVTLGEIRSKAEREHIRTFKWRKTIRTKEEYEKSKSIIAKQRLHVFWELIHIIVSLIGLILTIIAL